LSKVSKVRSSRAAHASTSGSFMPGAVFLTHDIMPSCNERRHGCTGKILVCKEAHVTLRWGRPFRNSACHGHMRDRP
jgi:hypothetical protein